MVSILRKACGTNMNTENGVSLMPSTLFLESPVPFHIYFTCPHCQAVRQVPEQYVGQSGSCNTCGGAITIDANTAPPLPRVATDSQPKSWYRERLAYFEYCRDHYEEAQRAFAQTTDDAHWKQRIQAAARCQERSEQVAFWERLVAEGIPWSVAFEYLVHYYVKEHDYERAFYFCTVYFTSDRWKNPQCIGSSKMLLKTMRKLDKKLFEN